MQENRLNRAALQEQMPEPKRTQGRGRGENSPTVDKKAERIAGVGDLELATPPENQASPAQPESHTAGLRSRLEILFQRDLPHLISRSGHDPVDRTSPILLSGL